MKKLLGLLILICISLSLVSMPILAEGNIKIVSSSVINGEKYANISSLIKIEFSGELGEINAEDVIMTAMSQKDGKETWSAVALKEIETNGKILKIRLAAEKKYNTEYSLDLSKVVSVDGRKLSGEEKIISFKTFYGEEYKIQEEDFETGAVNPQKWRAPRDGDVSAVVQRADDNGNFCYRIEDRTLDINVGQNGVVSPGPLHLANGDKYLIEYDLLLENLTADRTFFGLSLKNTDANLDYSTYYQGTICYSISKNSFYVRADDHTMADRPKPSNAYVEASQGVWNRLSIYINKNERKLRLYVNGTLATNPDGKYEFDLPMSGEIDDNFKASAINNLNFGTGGETGDYYVDNISIREIYDPILIDTNIKNGAILSTSCPQFMFDFRNNEVKKVTAYLNDELLNDDILQWSANGTLTLLPMFTFGENYNLKLSAEDMLGNQKDFEYNFSTSEMPTQLIEAVGFYNGGGRKITSIEPGELIARLRFWQKEEEEYLLLCGIYKEINGKIQLISLSAPKTVTASGNLVEESIGEVVPDNTEGCFMRIFVLKDSLVGLPYEKNIILGDLILK